MQNDRQFFYQVSQRGLTSRHLTFTKTAKDDDLFEQVLSLGWVVNNIICIPKQLQKN
jgi:hypothetical protein